MGYQIRPDPSNPLFSPMMGCLIALSESTYKNGVSNCHAKQLPPIILLTEFPMINMIKATAVIPGSHLWGARRKPELREAGYAEMKPGSALFTLGCGTATLCICP